MHDDCVDALRRHFRPRLGCVRHRHLPERRELRRVDRELGEGGDTTIQSAAGASVTLTSVAFGGSSSHIVVSDVKVTGGVVFNGGATATRSPTATSPRRQRHLLLDLRAGDARAVRVWSVGAGERCDDLVQQDPRLRSPTSTTGSDCNEDGIRLNNFVGVTIDHNELYDLIEDYDPEAAQ